MLKELYVNILCVKSLDKITGYVKFMKDLVARNMIVSYEPAENVHHYSVVSSILLVKKKEDPGAFTIICTIKYFKFVRGLYDLGDNINLMSLVVFK